MRLALVLLTLSLPALARSPGKHTQDYHQGANGSTVSGGALARYLTVSDGVASFSGVTFTRASAGAACTDSSGGVSFPASGVPCLAGGYHARPSIANLATNTAALDNASWTKSNATVTTNSAVAPDGTTTADTVTSTSAGGYIQQAFTSTGGAFSCAGYAQALTGTQDYAVVAYDVTGAAALKTTACTATTAWPLRSDLRCSASVSSTVSGHSIACRLYPGGTAGTGSVYAWGLQPEWSAFPNDYCPSGSTPATCAAEVATVPTPSGMSLTEGCAKVCVTPTWTGATPSTDAIFLSAGSSSIFAYAHSSQQVLYENLGTIATVLTTFTAGTRGCVVTRWSEAGNFGSITDVSSGASGSVAYTTPAAFGATVSIGALSGAKQPYGAIIDSIVLGSSPEACN